ncbi:MAG: DNA-directed RNA polymerase subunit omega [Rickettsiales bacterium]|nr:DNA-directed RNA polymerase subunit omega [Rickettsiales bacterium]|tara:strand:- start:18975 stop:19337 length:363 start_codon:yes stop_codon:yes gene_type:complete
MARVTVEDCIDKIPNRFDLVILAAERVREIISGSPAEIERDNDKTSVLALREIAGRYVNPETLRENLIRSNQKITPITDDEDVIEFLDEEQNWVNQPESAAMEQEIVQDDLTVTKENAVE